MSPATRELIRKEARSHAVLYAGTALLVLLVLLVLFCSVVRWYDTPFLTFATILASIITALAGALALGHEKETGTIEFLQALPVDGRQLWTLKVLHTGIVPLVLVLLVIVVLACFVGKPWRAVTYSELFAFVLVVLGMVVFAASLYAFSLLFSLFFDTVIMAALAGIAATCFAAPLVVLPIQFGVEAFEAAWAALPITQRMQHFRMVFSAAGVAWLTLAVVLALALLIGAVWLSRWLVCEKRIG